jgi:hypothetical protein
MREYWGNGDKTEISRSPSSEETIVMKVERRAKSSKQGFFFQVVNVMKRKIKKDNKVLEARMNPME